MSGYVRGAVFDMDGVMLDTERIAALAFDFAGEKTGIGPAGFMTPRLLGLSVETARPVWLAEFGEAYDEEGIIKFSAEFKREYYKTHDVPAKPGLTAALGKLKDAGYGLAVASSTSRETVEAELSSVGALRFFDAVVAGDMVKRSKPDPEIYLSACAELGLSPSVCTAFEDARSGVISAHTAGLRVIMIPDLWQPDDGIRAICTVCGDLLSAVRECMAGGVF